MIGKSYQSICLLALLACVQYTEAIRVLENENMIHVLKNDDKEKKDDDKEIIHHDNENELED